MARNGAVLPLYLETSSSGFFMMTPRAEAKSNKSPRYFTGLPCKYGHIDERYTISGNCVSCQQKSNTETAPSYYLTNTKRIKARVAAWKKANPNYGKNYYAENAEKFRADAVAWRAANPGYSRAQWPNIMQQNFGRRRRGPT
jgi:hypothetical protein